MIIDDQHLYRHPAIVTRTRSGKSLNFTPVQGCP
jgi:hypothetical protein